MNDRDFDKLVGRMADEHHNPPPTPRERMWRQVQAGRAQPVGRSRHRFMRTAWAAAAVLVIGIGIGRWSSPPTETGPVAVNNPVREAQLPDLYQQTTLALFNRADAMLTDFRVAGCTAGNLEPTGRWASEMLVQARLLQGTPVGEDPELEALLMDLELVLAQIVGISPDHCDRDVAWIRSGLNERSTLNRLRAVTDRRDVLDPI